MATKTTHNHGEPKGSEVSNPNAPTASPTPSIEGEPQGPSLQDRPDERTGKLENPDVNRGGAYAGAAITGISADVKKGPNVLDEESVRREREAAVKEATDNPEATASYKVLSGTVKYGPEQYGAKGETITLSGALAASLLQSGTIEKA